MEVLARIFLVCLSFSGFAAAQIPVNIPVHLVKTLDSLKKQDNLADWLYARIDYSYENPRQSLSFLMHTASERWRLPASTPEKEAWLMLLSNQGYNQMYTGNILNSIGCYEQAYNYMVEHKLNVEGVAEYVLTPWANNYTRLGDYEKALFIQQKTLDYARREHHDALAVSVYNNMAISYRSLGDYKKAEACIRLAAGKTGPNSAELILLDNTLADIYNDKNELHLAELVIKRNIARQRQHKQNFETAYWLLSSYITAGDIQRKKQQFTAAQYSYQQALAINHKYYIGNRLREKAYIYIQLGKIKLAQKQFAQSLVYFDEVLSTFGIADTHSKINAGKIFGDNRLIEVFYQKSLAYQQLGLQAEALQHIRFSLLSADRIRFELADVKTKQRFQAETKQMAEKAIAIAFSLLEKTRQHVYADIMLNIIEQTRARTLLDDIRRNQQQLTLSTKDPLFGKKAKLEQAIAFNERELLQGNEAAEAIEKRNGELKFKLEALEKKIRARYPSLKINKESLNATKSLLQQIPRNAHFIEFFSGTEHLYVVEIHHKHVKHIKRISNAEQVKKSVSDFVNTYYHQGPGAMMNQPKSFFMRSNQIYKTLLDGFSFPANEKLILIPDDVIGYLSFDGLITDENYLPGIASWPYLIRRHTVSYAFSIQTWLNQSTKQSDKHKGFAGLFVTHQNKSKQFIPAVAKEAESIAHIVEGVFLRDEHASVREFLNAFDEANVLHISTHSYLSGLQKEPTLAFDDDQVFLFELAARKTAPDLVVLSACRTADGIINTGEGIISLSRGFAAIGTGGTIAGLWNVNDQAASEITASCYSNMVKGEEISTALHHAKLHWLHTGTRPEQEYLPYYWDALIYMGYDKKLTLQPAGKLARYGKFAVLILTAFLGIYYLVKVKRKPTSPA